MNPHHINRTSSPSANGGSPRSAPRKSIIYTLAAGLVLFAVPLCSEKTFPSTGNVGIGTTAP